MKEMLKRVNGETADFFIEVTSLVQCIFGDELDKAYIKLGYLFITDEFRQFYEDGYKLYEERAEAILSGEDPLVVNNTLFFHGDSLYLIFKNGTEFEIRSDKGYISKAK